jgi:peptide/nickel transport system substrate-binding protein
MTAAIDRMWRRFPRSRAHAVLLILTALAVTSCAPASAPAGQPSASQRVAAPPQRALNLAIPREPPSLDASFINGANNGDFVAIDTAFLALVMPDQQPRPFLAESLPTLENGRWKVLPDGGMETTYALNARARWHDGRPITGDDYVFAFQVRMDPAVPVVNNTVERRMAEVRAIDDATLFIAWKEPYMWAGAVHSPDFAPYPRHLLETMYHEDLDQFVNGAHWRDQYVGSGPYRLERWVPGDEIVFRAFEGFVLGKPNIDEIRVKFIQDPNTVVANLLSGSLDTSFFNAIGYPQNLALEQAGWAGRTEYWRGQTRFLEFQQRDWGNLQKAVLDVRVRRAVLHALDRKGLVDGIYNGRAPVIHIWMHDSNPAFPAADRVATKYDYNPQRATALLQEAGWTRGADGVARNAAGEALALPVLAQTGDVENQENAVLVDNWKAAGITSDLIQLTPQLSRDTEFRSKYPAMAYNRRGFGLEDMAWTRDNVTLPERRWAGNNRNGYVNPVLDDLWHRALGTVDVKEREPLLVEAIKVMTEDAVVNPIILQPRAVAYRNGLAGPREPWVDEGAIVWNIWEWRWE